MSKFSVGDRVVVVGEHNSFRLQRGEVVELNLEQPWPIKVKLPNDAWSTPIPYGAEELEFEHVYDQLSKPASEVDSSPSGDVVNHPSHYADGWSNGAEVIDITEHLNFNRGNAVKYLSRAGKKGGAEKELEDLQKALWYVRREVERLGGSVE